MIHCSMASLHEAVNCRVFLGNSCVVALFLKNGGMAKLCEDESEAKRNWASAVFVPAGKDMPATRRSDDDESTGRSPTWSRHFCHVVPAPAARGRSKN